MAKQSHLKRLKQGVDAWNAWREEHPKLTPDLSGADLPGADLPRVNFSGANLSGANLSGANLFGVYLVDADLSGANLSDAYLSGASCFHAYLSRANFSGANLFRAYLYRADLSGADLTNASMFSAFLTNTNLTGARLQNAVLEQAILVETDVTDANFTGCKVYGISVWNPQGEPTEQNNLLITGWDHVNGKPLEPAITVDNLEVAQFIYMLINYKKLRDVIQAVSSKVVLILGRFTEERLGVLKALQEELRRYTEAGKAKYIPVMFDFDPDEASEDLLETVQTIAGMSRFIIADVTSAKGVLVELASIIPHCKVPIKFVFDTSTRERPVKMLKPFKSYPWLVLSAPGKYISGYSNSHELCASIKDLIEPIEQMVDKVRKAKAEEDDDGVENLSRGNE